MAALPLQWGLGGSVSNQLAAQTSPAQSPRTLPNLLAPVGSGTTPPASGGTPPASGGIPPATGATPVGTPAASPGGSPSLLGSLFKTPGGSVAGSPLDTVYHTLVVRKNND